MNQENGEEKRPPGFNRPFSLLLIYQLRKAILWSDEWGAPQRALNLKTESCSLRSISITADQIVAEASHWPPAPLAELVDRLTLTLDNARRSHDRSGLESGNHGLEKEPEPKVKLFTKDK